VITATSKLENCFENLTVDRSGSFVRDTSAPSAKNRYP
jgi:hypothetical protein